MSQRNSPVVLMAAGPALSVFAVARTFLSRLAALRFMNATMFVLPFPLYFSVYQPRVRSKRRLLIPEQLNSRSLRPLMLSRREPHC